MSSSQPTVSVVMCTFNGEKYIKDQLDSILAQTYPIDEIIVQDDCSTDKTVDIIKDYSQKYTYIKLFVNEHNLGFNANFHHALARATCDYVAISDQDDIWYPQKIERQMSAIGEKDLCGTAYDIGPSLEVAHYLAASDTIERFTFGGGVAGHSMLLSREFLLARNQWFNGITYDWSLLMNAYFDKGVIILSEALNWHRRHDRALGNVFNKRSQNKMLSNVAPYLLGWTHYRRLQKKSNWREMYSYIESHTNETYEPVAHQLASLLLRPGVAALLKLCFKCYKYRDMIYPDKQKTSGFMGHLRAFAYPAIFAYSNYYFDWAD